VPTVKFVKAIVAERLGHPPVLREVAESLNHWRGTYVICFVSIKHNFIY